MSTDEIGDYWKTGGGLFFSEQLSGMWYSKNLTALSYLGNAMLAAIIYLNKDLKHVHPMKLFMMIALCDSIMFWFIWIEPFICTLELNKILTYSIFFSLNDDHLLWVTRFMAYLINTSTVFCYIVSLNLNICVCIDMVLMIKNPFTK